MNSLDTGQSVELLANIRRLTAIVLDRLEKGSAEGTLDQGQVRMLSSTALRSLKLWKETLVEARKVWGQKLFSHESPVQDQKR